MRIGDSNLVDPNKGLHTYHSWFTLSREAIPKTLRDKGFDNYNIPRFFELKYNAATASSTGKLDYNGAEIDMPPTNLLGFSKFREDVQAGKSANYLSNLPRADPLDKARPSTCWASSADEQSPELTLTLTEKSPVFKVAVRSYFPDSEEVLSEQYLRVREVLANASIPLTLIPAKSGPGPQVKRG